MVVSRFLTAASVLALAGVLALPAAGQQVVPVVAEGIALPARAAEPAPPRPPGAASADPGPSAGTAAAPSPDVSPAVAPDAGPETGAAAAPEPEDPGPPPPPRSPVVSFGPDDLQPDATLRRARVPIRPAPEAAEMPPIAPTAGGAEAMNLRRWIAEGRAAGLAGVLYDNRDGGHSRLSPERFPQLTHIEYDAALQARDAHRALADRFLFPVPVLGNASMAVTAGPTARSLPRLAMTFPGGPAAAYVGYVHNHLYVYPGHHDIGDVDAMPAALPYFVVSRGSSRSDQPHLNALALAMASLPPDTFARARDEGLLAPLLVMLMRRSLAGVTEYASPAAHPAAIEGGRIRSAVMMSAAQAVTADAIPPMVRLRVLGEEFGDRAGLAGQGERLFDTPSAIARLWRGWAGRRQMVVTAVGTADPNGRALQFRWFLIAGDPERVRIEPMAPDGQSARLTIDWHDTPIAAAPGGKPGNRVEIGVVAWNGAQYSAPALISVAFPHHEQRVYAEGPDGALRIVSVDYDAIGRGARFDPVLWWSAPWRDQAMFDTAGRLVAWRRFHAGGGIDIVTADAPGSYRFDESDQARPSLVWEPAAP